MKTIYPRSKVKGRTQDLKPVKGTESRSPGADSNGPYSPNVVERDWQKRYRDIKKKYGGGS